MSFTDLAIVMAGLRVDIECIRDMKDCDPILHYLESLENCLCKAIEVDQGDIQITLDAQNDALEYIYKNVLFPICVVSRTQKENNFFKVVKIAMDKAKEARDRYECTCEI